MIQTLHWRRYEFNSFIGGGDGGACSCRVRMRQKRSGIHRRAEGLQLTKQCWAALQDFQDCNKKNTVDARNSM